MNNYNASENLLNELFCLQLNNNSNNNSNIGYFAGESRDGGIFRNSRTEHQ